MNHNSEAKVREEKKEQFQVHALINTDREEMGSVPDRVPRGGNFSVPRYCLCVGVGVLCCTLAPWVAGMRQTMGG